MALTLQSANLVRQKALNSILTQAVGTTQGTGDPIAFYALKSFFLNWAQKGNADLAIKPFSEADADAAGGTALVDAACRVYFVYTRKENSATDNWTKVYDDSTDDSTDGDAVISLPQLEALADAFYVSSKGVPMATGVVVTQHTTQVGSTDGSNGASGFVIVGAA
jgi:hypothetical protein